MKRVIKEKQNKDVQVFIRALSEFLASAEVLKTKAAEVETDKRRLRSFQQTIDALMSYYKDD